MIVGTCYNYIIFHRLGLCGISVMRLKMIYKRYTTTMMSTMINIIKALERLLTIQTNNLAMVQNLTMNHLSCNTVLVMLTPVPLCIIVYSRAVFIWLHSTRGGFPSTCLQHRPQGKEVIRWTKWRKWSDGATGAQLLCLGQLKKARHRQSLKKSH